MSNKCTVKNPHFSQDAADYLLQHGFQMEESRMVTGVITFRKDDLAAAVYGDNIDFLMMNDGEGEQRREGYSRTMAVTSISELDSFDWILLFHIAKLVPVREFFRAVKVEYPQANPLFVKMFEEHFRVTEDHEAVPVNY